MLEPVVFEPKAGVRLPAYLVMLVGVRYHCGNVALQIHELNTLGPDASGLGLRSSVLSDRPAHARGCGHPWCGVRHGLN